MSDPRWRAPSKHIRHSIQSIMAPCMPDAPARVPAPPAGSDNRWTGARCLGAGTVYYLLPARQLRNAPSQRGLLGSSAWVVPGGFGLHGLREPLASLCVARYPSSQRHLPRQNACSWSCRSKHGDPCSDCDCAERPFAGRLYIIISILIATEAPYSPFVELGLSSIASLVLAWIICRNSLILPSAAIGHRMTTSESWRATADRSGSIVILLIVGTVAHTGLLHIAERAMPFQPAFLLALQILFTCLQALIVASFTATLYQEPIKARKPQ